MRNIILAVLLGLALSASAFAEATADKPAIAADPFLANLKAGQWTGKVTESVSPALKGKAVTATTEATADQVKITVRVEGAAGEEREEWVVTPARLTQTDFDAAGKVVGAPYAANVKLAQTNTARTYEINCANRATNQCDNGVDFRNKWALVASGNTLKYIVTGLKDKAKPDSLGTRHVFEFTQAAGK